MFVHSLGLQYRFNQRNPRTGFSGAFRSGLLTFMLTVGFHQVFAEETSVDFNRDVAPILINHCLECHHRGKASGGLNLALAEGLQKGGDTGPAIAADKNSSSLLIERVVAGEMPPPEKGKRQPLVAADVAVLRAWIAAGASWPTNRELGLHEQKVSIESAREFWSYQPILRPPVPKVGDGTQVINPIDAFVGAKLEAAGLRHGAVASPRQLLRRAWLDLVGLPPSLAEQEQLSVNDSPEAYAETVDRLLANKGYGERWARHWLDLVRYADSNGYERDGSKPSVWRYRDYVIESLNRDKPYDRFVIEQLAGDELPDRSLETVIATGFHALGAWQDEVDPLEAAQYRADELDDMLRTTSQTFLGVTVGCARCHNHKFDPISMVDYYSLSATTISSIRFPWWTITVFRPSWPRSNAPMPVAMIVTWPQGHWPNCARLKFATRKLRNRIAALMSCDQ